MLAKNAWIALIRLFNVPRVLLIAASAGTTVVDIAVPIRLIAATMAPQSTPTCALTGCGAISDTMSTRTRSFVRCSHKTCHRDSGLDEAESRMTALGRGMTTLGGAWALGGNYRDSGLDETGSRMTTSGGV